MGVKHRYGSLVEVPKELDLLIGLRVFIIDEGELASARVTTECAMPYSSFTDKDYVAWSGIQGGLNDHVWKTGTSLSGASPGPNPGLREVVPVARQIQV